jgi:hypothetical protein
MLNRDLFVHDPTTFAVPNDGVSKVGVPTSEGEWRVLRYELESFVCEGEYHRGLERILSQFLDNLKRPEQRAVWVSGFYGSGKSHLVRVLEALWRDVEFPDGARARGLLHLPTDIAELVIELSTAGRRQGGLWSAAGKAGATGETQSTAASVRLAVLGVVLRGAGLPEQYSLARFVIWLRQNGFYEAVRQAVEAQGRQWERELRSLAVSTAIAPALLRVYPGFAADAGAARALLAGQYPTHVPDISDEDLLRTIEEVLELSSDTPGRLPLALIVLDELQQFLHEDPERVLQLQNVVEACTTHFENRLLFVATGQSALQASPQLAKLQDRFSVQIMLADKDVQQVIRSVVLRKAPEKVPALQQTLSSVQGEIDSHLPGSKIAPCQADRDDLVPDYPLLPARRRFWERALRKVDSAGTSGQLRTQLRIVQEANRSVAGQPAGHVIPADFIYQQRKANMLQSGALLPEIADKISQADDGSPEGALRSRLCALIFLISQLDAEGPLAAGLQATADNLAHLLVTDLQQGSAALRQQVPRLLEGLVESGTLMMVDGQYRLQTREAAEWQKEYDTRYTRIRNDDARIASARGEALQQAFQAEVGNTAMVQGASKTSRKPAMHWGLERPADDNVRIWVRDAWTVTGKTVRDDAQAASLDGPHVYVLLPRVESDALRDALAACAAAQEVLDARGVPATAEGIEARKAMESRLQIQNQQRDALLAKVLEEAVVYQGGGTEAPGNGLAEMVRVAVEAGYARLYPHFHVADHPSWGQVISQARDGSAEALGQVGHTGSAANHAVCHEIRIYLGTTVRKGSEVRKHFQSPPYGWPQDAIDGGLYALLAEGLITAQRHGQPQTAKQLDRQQLGATEFRPEGTVITVEQRLVVRALLADLGIPFQKGEELAALPALFAALRGAAEGAGGEPPLPERPAAHRIGELEALAGNERFVAVSNAADDLRAWHAAWTAAGKKSAERLPRWQTAIRLATHAATLPQAQAAVQALEAVRAQRALLDDPDPAAPHAQALASALRAELQVAVQAYQAVYDREMGALAASDAWQRIGASECQAILEECGIAPALKIAVGTEEEILASLEARSLATWAIVTHALAGSFQEARVRAATLLAPKAVYVKPKSATLEDVAAAEAYLAALREEIVAHLNRGNPVII